MFTPDRSIVALGMELISVAVLDLTSADSTGMMVWLVTSSYRAQNILFRALIQAHNTALRAIRALHCDIA